MLPRWFERDRVGDRCAAYDDPVPCLVVDHWLIARPGATVETIQHQTAPITVFRLWGLLIESDAECDRIGERQRTDVARAHCVAQAGSARTRVDRYGPEWRRNAWEKYPHR